MDDNKGFINKAKLNELFIGKEVFLYGLGQDCEIFLSDYDHGITVKGFIDSYRYGTSYFGKSVISPDQFIQRFKGTPIVIMALKYVREIRKKLENLGLSLAQDFYIYDNNFILYPDQITKDFILFNEKRWRPYKIDKDNNNNIVLIPFNMRHSAYDMLRAAYVSNFYAKQTNSLIYAYIRFGIHIDNVGENFKKIYQSLNVSDIVDDSLSESQLKESEKIVNDLWGSLHSWADWRNISVDGIKFGNTILSHMMRHIIPALNADDKSLLPFLKNSVNIIVFWRDFFKSHNVNLVLLGDGVGWDGYIREIALAHNVPCFNTTEGISKMVHDYNFGSAYPNFKKFWKELTPEEKENGIEIAKNKLSLRLDGASPMLEGQCDKNVYANDQCVRQLKNNDKTKILICPHIFEENSYYNGDFLFDNSYISWLTHLGELSAKTPNFDWYLKMHPASAKRDFFIMDMLCKKYPRIKMINSNVSPIQLKEEGISLALTIGGTIAQEYPLIGIEVITCGNYPGIAFDFAWNAKTIEEYDSLILNASTITHKGNYEEIYQCYAINYLYYDWKSLYVPINFCDNPHFFMYGQQLRALGMDNGTWKYKVYMEECTDDRHNNIMTNIPDILKKAESWRSDVFYKKKQIEL